VILLSCVYLGNTVASFEKPAIWIPDTYNYQTFSVPFFNGLLPSYFWSGNQMATSLHRFIYKELSFIWMVYSILTFSKPNLYERFSNWLLNSGQFDFRTQINHLKTGLVHISDGRWKLECFQISDVGIWTPTV
jgi:hypothetical protein